MHRRHYLALALAIFAALAHAPAWAQSWPDRAVRLILPYAPGGATDAIGRPWADKLGQAFGQPFVVENRGGASGMIGTEAAAKATPDGYTFLLTPQCSAGGLPSLRKTPTIPEELRSGRPRRRYHQRLCHPPLRRGEDLPGDGRLRQKEPGKLTFASSGSGTSTHLRLEMLKLKAGIDILHVPYRGGADSLNDVLPGNVHMMNEPVFAAACQGRQAHLAQYQRRRAPSQLPRGADLDRTRHHRRGRPDLVSVFARPARRRTLLQAQRQNRRDCQERGHEEQNVGGQCRGAVADTEEMATHLLQDIKANAELIQAANIKLD
jgi:hypothetical protein